MATDKLYRGYLVYTYDSKETVEVVRPDHGKSDVWQSRERLKELLDERIAGARRGTTLAKDVEAHIETISTERVSEGESDD